MCRLPLQVASSRSGTGHADGSELQAMMPNSNGGGAMLHNNNGHASGISTTC
jgi:hypothetical protein